MFPTKPQDIKFLKRIYNYITPVIIICEKFKTIKKENDGNKEVMKDALRLIRNMRNTACHNILKGNFIQQLFVNMVKLYKYFELNLENENYVKELWDTIDENDRKFKICTFDESTEQIEIIDYEFPDVKNKCKTFYKKFKEFLKIMIKSGKQCEIFKESLPNIHAIYQQVVPNFLWYRFFGEKDANENENDLFYKINFDIRTCVAHFLEKVENSNDDKKLDETNLKRIMGNIYIMYLSFGIDLYTNRKNVKDLLQATPNKYEIVRENTNFIDGTSQKNVKEIIETIKNVLCNINNPLNKKYFLFGQMLHYLVSTKIERGAMITQVFQRNNNNIEWCGVDKRFILKDSEENLLRKSIWKLASPIFVWYEIVNKLESTEYKEPFYLSIRDLRQKIIGYLRNNENDESYIYKKMKSLYKPIEQWFNTDETLHNYPKRFQYSDIFNKLVEHSVIGRKKRRFSYSFIFQFYHLQENVTVEMEYTGKMFDIFNFCGLFYIFIKYFENVADNSFYEKVKEITDLITDYMQQEIQNTRKNNIDLQNKIIDEIKSIFPELTNFIPEFMKEEIRNTHEINIDLHNKIIDEINSIFPELTRLIEEYMKHEKQDTPENNIDVQNEIIKEIILVFPQSIYKITNYMIKKILNKDKFDEKSIEKLNGKIESIFRKIVDQLIQLANKDKSDNEKIIIDENKLKFHEIADQITNYMELQLNKTIDILSKLQNKIINKMKLVFLNRTDQSNNNSFPDIFNKLYSYVVRSRPNVEMSFIDS